CHRPTAEIPAANDFQGLKPELPFMSLSITNEAPRENAVRAQGQIASRPLLAKIIPPPQIGPDVSSNTVVQVAIQADGFPFTARIVASSGSRVADLTALQLANDAQFS